MNISNLERVFFAIILILCILNQSCQTGLKEINITTLTPEKTIESWGDSIYLRRTHSLHSDNSGLIIVDYSGHRLLKLNREFELEKIIGKNGKGPGEMINPAFLVFQSSKYYVLDRGNKRVNIYRPDGSYEKMVRLMGEVNVLGKFSVDQDENIYISSNTEDYLFSKFNSLGERILTFGRPDPQTPSYLPKYTNISHLLYDDTEKVIAIKISEPAIEVYSINGQLLDRYDLSNSLVFQAVQAHLKSAYQSHPGPGLMYIPIFRDALLHNGKLFLLYNDMGEFKGESQIHSNKILILDIDNGMKESAIINLKIEGDEEEATYFTAFCIQEVPQKSLIAFEQVSGKLYCFPY